MTVSDVRLDEDLIRQIPPSPGLSFRGRGSGTWTVGRSYTEAGWLHTSRHPRIGSDDFAHGNIVALFGACGRDVQSVTGFPDEHETLFMPGSTFSVLRQGFVGTVWLQILVVLRDDLRPERVVDLEVQVRRSVDTVRRAMSSPPAHPLRPERFRGGFGVQIENPTPTTTAA